MLRLNSQLLIGVVMCGVMSSYCHAAPEEMQVYRDEMDTPGQFGLDLHTNYVVSGDNIPAYPGAVSPVHLFRLTPEFSYGLTHSFELGAYLQSDVIYGGGYRHQRLGSEHRFGAWV